MLVEADNNATSIYLAEMILGALEAFLATSLHSETMPYRPNLTIVVQPSDFLSGLPEYNEDELISESKLVVKHPVNLIRTNQQERNAFHSWLQDFIVHTMFQIAVVSNVDSFADRLIKSEAGIGRALIFAEVDIAINNILGDSPKLRISDWKSETDTTTYPFKRTLPWYIGLPSDDKEDKKRPPMKFGQGEPPAYLFDTDNLKHTDFQVISLISVPLWDKAQWHATAYICPPDQPPIVVLGFGDAEAGKLIFKEWRSKLGQIDEDDQIRLSFITGVDKKHPSHYRMVVSSNLKLMERSDKNLFAIALRIKTLEPPDLTNLNNFLTAYEKFGLYRLVPGHVIPGQEAYTPMFEYWIGKHELIVRPAWQVGEHDPDVMAIYEDTDPIIPEDVKNAPVLQALKRFSKRKKRRH